MIAAALSMTRERSSCFHNFHDSNADHAASSAASACSRVARAEWPTTSFGADGLVDVSSALVITFLPPITIGWLLPNCDFTLRSAHCGIVEQVSPKDPQPHLKQNSSDRR